MTMQEYANDRHAMVRNAALACLARLPQNDTESTPPCDERTLPQHIPLSAASVQSESSAEPTQRTHHHRPNPSQAVRELARAAHKAHASRERRKQLRLAAERGDVKLRTLCAYARWIGSTA